MLKDKPERTKKGHGKVCPFLVDSEGVMFQVGLGNYDDVPVLSGLEFSQSNSNPLNSRLPLRLYPLVAALGSLKELRPELYDMGF